MKSIFIIADDLTGAADTGVQFCPFFEDTTLISYQQLDRILEPSPASASRATAVYTNSRALAHETARQRLVSVAQGLAKKQPLWIYKKIDSCMRGNVGAEVEALLDELDYEVSFITPAFPEMGRTTENDIHRVHGIPLEQTEISRDPITPVKESHLSRIVQSQSRYRVGHVALTHLDGSEKELQAEIDRQIQRGFRHFVFDATHRYQLDRVANLVYSFPGKVLPVGSAGLAGSLTEPLSPAKRVVKSGSEFEGGNCNLLVCGTASEVTGRQIDRLLEKHSYEFIQLPPELLVDQRLSDDFSRTVSSTRSSLSRKNVVLTITSQRNAQAAPRAANLQEAAESIVRGLGLFVAEVVADTRPAYLFLTGGDTADAVLTTIGAEGIRILGEVVAGVVQGVLIGGPLEGLPVVTKAGAFGHEDTLVVLHERWHK
ncbi:MAG: four-carbon acid sugar kinase family protein [Desulfobacterales bacterium]|nr:MAG: four-carbon acid sugar kinase family protein [Desulfobacterales bacterium]